jgi:UDP-glucose 4-epimerase
VTLSQARVLVTGATGFIGRHVCRRLVELGAVVYGLARSASMATVSDGVVPLAADVTDRVGVIAALEQARPTLVLHMAAAGVTEPFLPMEQAVKVNVSGTINVLEASYEVGVQRFVQVGTAYEHPASETERGPNNPYVASKMAAWLFWRAFVEKNAIDSLAVRLYHMYGPGQVRGLIPAAMQAALRNETFRMTPGEQLRDFVYIDDVVEGLVATLTSPDVHGKTYDIGSGIGRQVKAVVRHIFDLMDSRGQYVLSALEYRPNEEMELIAAPATAKTDLNWIAQVPFEEGIVTTIEAYRRQTRSL